MNVACRNIIIMGASSAETQRFDFKSFILTRVVLALHKQRVQSRRLPVLYIHKFYWSSYFIYAACKYVGSIK